MPPVLLAGNMFLRRKRAQREHLEGQHTDAPAPPTPHAFCGGSRAVLTLTESSSSGS